MTSTTLQEQASPASLKSALIGRLLVLGGVTLIGLIHFVLTLIYCLPVTPIRTALSPLLIRYMIPLFSQNWSFFAPTPPTNDESVVVQYQYVDAAGISKESEWINLSQTFNKACQRNRLSSLELIQLIVENASGDLKNTEIFDEHGLNQGILQSEILQHRQPPALHVLERVGMAFFPSTKLAGTPVAIRVAFLTHDFPHFNHRTDRDDPNLNNTILLFPYVAFEAVTPL